MYPSSFGRVLITCLVLLSSLFPALAERELHVVGIYEGENGGTTAKVYLNRPGQSVTLFLNAYDQVDWRVTVGAGTTLERVFLSGYYRQTVQGIPAEVPVTAFSSEEGTSYIPVGYMINSSRFLRAVPKIVALTGQEISSFQGSYQAPVAGFTVNSVQNDPRLSSSYPQPVPRAELPAVQFDVVTYDGRLTFRHYDLGGPQDEGLLLDFGPVVNLDASGQFYYGGDDGLLEINAQTGAAREIPMLDEIRREGWQMGTTFDRKRNRALLVTLAGEGFLYGYSPVQKQWNLRVSMQNRDYDCITYHDADDSLYAVTLSHEDSYSAKVVKLTAGGAFEKEIALPIFPFDIEPGGQRAELVSAGEYLVLLLAPGRYSRTDSLSESRMYLIDPRTSELWLTYRQVGPPNQRPDVVLYTPPGGTVVSPGSTVRLNAQAMDHDGTVASVEFFVGDQSIGLGTRDLSNGLFAINWTAPESGTHEVVARATDDKGGTRLSAPLTFVVDRPPTITITAPANGSSVEVGSDITLTATAQDSDGSIDSVVFTFNGQALGAATRIAGTDSYTLPWTAAAPGTFTFGAIATDNLGAVAQATTVQVIVRRPAEGTVRAIRFLPRFYVPGKKLTVVITARSSSPATSYTVVDRLPEGWTVNGISSGGKFDPQTGTVTFGPFADRRARALVYRASPPSTATGPQQFTGSVNVNESESPISGDAEVIQNPRTKRGRPSLLPEQRQPYE